MMAKQDHQFPNPKPAYLYARFSSLRQKEGHSIERQLTYGRAFIEQQGWTLAAEFKDCGSACKKDPVSGVIGV
ncbi:recombinase family protein [Sphingobium aquiterrae]|uniref:recombinase family protein n=1 Tax=Sphingobium aquiterrae TaxID=2038656 RepID=UPI0030191B08